MACYGACSTPGVGGVLGVVVQIKNQHKYEPVSVPNSYKPKAITKQSSNNSSNNKRRVWVLGVGGQGLKFNNNIIIQGRRQGLIVRAAENMSTTTTEKLGVKIQRNPPESKLTELGARNWPKWGCLPSKFPWTYNSKETCYLLKGKVKVYPDGSDEAVEIGAGDLVEFPKGMSCTWDVSEAVDKHYKFE